MRYEDSREVAEVLGQLTVRQLWVLVKICKTVRLRCRNNKAFNNYFGRIFPYASFDEVTKFKEDGSSYPGLQITVGGDTISGDENDE